MKTTANGMTAAQVNNNRENVNAEKRRSIFHVFRDVTRRTDDGELLPTPWRREWLHLTPAGRYMWGEHEHATEIHFSDSCRIVENLQTHGNAYRFNYGKIWQY